MIVALSVMILRIKDKHRTRPFKAPGICLVGPLAVAGCITLFLFLPTDVKLVFPIWSGIGLIFYFLYGYRKSHVARGIDTPVGGEDVIVPVRPLVDYSADNTSSKGRH